VRRFLAVADEMMRALRQADEALVAERADAAAGGRPGQSG
jgi:hypothetical protein